MTVFLSCAGSLVGNAVRSKFGYLMLTMGGSFLGGFVITDMGCRVADCFRSRQEGDFRSRMQELQGQIRGFGDDGGAREQVDWINRCRTVSERGGTLLMLPEQIVIADDQEQNNTLEERAQQVRTQFSNELPHLDHQFICKRGYPENDLDLKVAQLFGLVVSFAALSFIPGNPVFMCGAGLLGFVVGMCGSLLASHQHTSWCRPKVSRSS